MNIVISLNELCFSEIVSHSSSIKCLKILAELVYNLQPIIIYEFIQGLTPSTSRYRTKSSFKVRNLPHALIN